jgi:citrate synthase
LIGSINMTGWLDRSSALARLAVRPQTLYAYVSRGRIDVRPDPRDPRRSLYRASDVEALAARRARGRKPAAIAASAIAWGEPAITTSVSTVAHGRPTYAGVDAIALAEHATLEDVAALLWCAAAPVALPSTTRREACGRAAALAALAALAASQPATIGRDAPSLRADAAAAVAALAGALGGTGRGAVHRRLARGWSVDRDGAEVLRRALVLLADHELNASTFAARVAASTGAPIAACLLAGLATLSGPRHGGAADALATLLCDARRLGADAAVARWQERDGALPGFGHPLYPEGDPRATALLSSVALDVELCALRDAALAATHAPPNVDFALLAVARALALPEDAPFRLFAVARSVGWAAHAIEQVGTGQLIRPRARYVPRPEHR